VYDIDGEDAHITAQELKEQAQALADLLHAVESDAKEQDLLIDDGKTTLSPETIIYQTRHNSPYEYSYQEIQDLELLLRCASERGCVMECWY